MREGSPGRLVGVALLLAMLGAGAAWNLWDWRAAGGAPPPVTPPAAQTAPSPVPAERTAPDPAAPVGPATGDYAELATATELEHPATDPHIARWFGWFEPVTGSWANRAAVWDQVVEGLREEAAALGPPYNFPLYHGDTAQPALVEVIWGVILDDLGTGGDVALAEATHSRDGRVATRVWAFLVAKGDEGNGNVVARSEPFDLFVADYRSFDDFDTARNTRAWEWVVAQGATEDHDAAEEAAR